MNNHTGPTFTRTRGSTFSHINARQSCHGGRFVLGTRDHITTNYDIGSAAIFTWLLLF